MNSSSIVCYVFYTTAVVDYVFTFMVASSQLNGACEYREYRTIVNIIIHYKYMPCRVHVQCVCVYTVIGMYNAVVCVCVF